MGGVFFRDIQRHPLRNSKIVVVFYLVFDTLFDMKDNDPTFTPQRQAMVAKLNSEVASDDPQVEKTRLEQLHGVGNVFDTSEATAAFEFKSFLAPFVFVTRKSDGKSGLMEFQHYPRFYFGFKPKN